MSEWTRRKREPTNIRGMCVICDKNPQKASSNGKYKAICSPCDKKLYDVKRNERISLTKRKYRRGMNIVCERCGFVPEHTCQLDVHHIDRNHSNDAPSNLQTLCANCHRLEHS